MSLDTPDWRRRAVVYQVYPKSFRDGSGDGVGDIPGLIDGLDHIADLGADVVWLSPIFASPMVDNGYDVSDYTAVNPLFGTMADFDRLIAEANTRKLRVVLDIALNHTSTDHPWFQEALRDPNGPKGDWYFFRDGRCGGPPNNWRSIFGGPAWSQGGGEGRFYLHLFDRTQADLNWEVPEVRQAIYAAMRFWLDRGVGGFRLDVVSVIAKPALNDVVDPSPEPLYRHLAASPRLLDHLREMRREVFAKYDCIAIGEAPGVDPALAARLVDPADPMLDVLYHFDLVAPKSAPGGGYDRAAFKEVFRRWDEGVGARGWNSVVLSNHDLGRIVSRFGDDGRYWRESATALQTLVLMTRGTPFLYQGDEIGMTNCPFAAIDELDDVWAKTTYRLKLEKGRSPEDAFAAAAAMTRDHARTPFQWNAGENAGFAATGAKPWLKLNPNHATINVAAQQAAPDSPLAHARRLIALRRADALWTDGTFALEPSPDDAFVFRRRHAGREGLVAINLRNRELALSTPLPESAPSISNYSDAGARDRLRPFEARVFAPEPI